MPPRVKHQSEEIRTLFREKIREKLAREKKRLMRDIDEEVPSWISWVVKPLASWEFKRGHARDAAVGWIGEKAAALSFWAFLPSSWVVMHDVVLEIDHLLVGPPGVYLIETKRWEGAFLCHNDRWKRKEGERWVPCKSPTAQNLRHSWLFRKWLESNLSGQLPVGDWVHPVVLLLGASWLRVDGSSMPVFDSGLGLAWYLRGQTGQEVLSAVDVELLTDAVASARPLASAAARREKETPALPVRVREGTTTDGRRYVVVRGTREGAERVWQSYVDRGENAKPLRADRSGRGWFFYVD